VSPSNDVAHAIHLISPPKGTPAATLDTARVAYIQLLGSLGSNADVKAEVTRLGEGEAAGSWRPPVKRLVR
jgi:hypothetical protein